MDEGDNNLMHFDSELSLLNQFVITMFYQRNTYYSAKDTLLEIQAAPYMVMDDERRAKLYHSCGDIRFLSLLPSNHATRLLCADLLETKQLSEPMLDMLWFDLALTCNPIKTISTIWPISATNGASWQSYSSHVVTTKTDVQLDPREFEMAHHMLKKYLLECRGNPWCFIVRMDMSCMNQIGRYGNLCRRSMPPTPIFGNDTTLDRCIVPHIPISDLMTMTRCSQAMRINIWHFLWKHGI